MKMMHVMYNIAFTVADVASKTLTLPEANYLKCQVTAKLLKQVICSSNYLIEPSPRYHGQAWYYPLL